MAWVLLADDRLMEVADSPIVRTLRLGDEVPFTELQASQTKRDMRPGILIGRGPGPGATPAQDQAAYPPNRQELDELVRNVVGLGPRLNRGRHFVGHFQSHRHLLERATGHSYPQTPAGEVLFLRELGQLITAGTLKPVGIATIKKGEPMVYVFQGQGAAAGLTALVTPTGEWVTLLSSGIGMDLGLQFQMRFDHAFPFPFLKQRPKGGFDRTWSTP